MKKIIMLLSICMLCFSMTACGTNNVKTELICSTTTPYPTSTPYPTPTPKPDNYLTFEEAQSLEGYFIKHGNWYISLSYAYQNNSSSSIDNYILLPVERYSELPENAYEYDELLKFNADTDKIVYFNSHDVGETTDPIRIAPTIFYGYALPITFSDIGYSVGYSSSSFSGAGMGPQYIDNRPIAETLTENVYVTDHNKEVTISGYKGTQYIEEKYCATAACYEVRHHVGQEKIMYGNANGAMVNVRDYMKISRELTQNGYMEIVFQEPFEKGIYIFKVPMPTSSSSKDILIEVE